MAKRRRPRPLVTLRLDKDEAREIDDARLAAKARLLPACRDRDTLEAVTQATTTRSSWLRYCASAYTEVAAALTGAQAEAHDLTLFAAAAVDVIEHTLRLADPARASTARARAMALVEDHLEGHAGVIAAELAVTRERMAKAARDAATATEDLSP